MGLLHFRQKALSTRISVGMRHNKHMPSEITSAPHREMGLSDVEYQAIVLELNREPTLTELGMFAVLWSEHCSYKSSKNVLKYFSEYRRATEGDGLENAGVIPIGDGYAVSFKVESHNHPSAVEPYQGAATGVGGIIRDILSMGARPIALLNSLRFGDITKKENEIDRRLFANVVSGIGGYGNCVGVPTVAGEVGFHKSYSGNPLVNAMCVGIVKQDELATSSAKGIGNAVVYFGSETGKDGIHGATFASEVLGEESEQKRPNVQIGDPFMGKLLVEATLEALRTGAVVAIQDMGAAGLTCSTCEMSARGGVGMEINLDYVPLREQNMSAYEIMLSESQERMLAIVEHGRENEILLICKKWGIPAAVIGHVTSDGRVKVYKDGKLEADIPAKFIADECPTVDLYAEEPDSVKQAAQWNPEEIKEPRNYESALLQLLRSPNITSKKWVYEQYDSSVQTQTSIHPGAADASVLAIRGTQKGLAVKIDCNAHYVHANPYVGGQLTFIEAARNVACTGAKPIGATDCLNFGNPNDSGVYFHFRESVRGLADASEKLEIPVLSGNVSFYNETEEGPVLPTPTVGVVGLLDDVENRVSMGFPAGVGFIYLIGYHGRAIKQEGLGASEYARTVHDCDNGSPESPDMEGELELNKFLYEVAQDRLITCSHDVSAGGIAVALAEMCAVGKAGCYTLIDADEHLNRHILSPLMEKIMSGEMTPTDEVQRAIIDSEIQFNPWTFSNRTDSKLFGEIPGRVLIGVSADGMRSGNLERLRDLVNAHKLFIHCIGTYDVANTLFVVITPSKPLLRVPLSDVRNAYFNSICDLMGESS